MADVAKGFDPACDFLLAWTPDNLFDRASAKPGSEHRVICRGCGDELNLWDAKRHHRMHKSQRARQRALDIRKARERGLDAARAARKERAE